MIGNSVLRQKQIGHRRDAQVYGQAVSESSAASTHALAASLTRSASAQTYYTVRLLVDRNLVQDAYRAYAYFRWVDDTLDQPGIERAERVALATRQAALIDGFYGGDSLTALNDYERMLADLIGRDRRDRKNSGLQSYIRNMMAVMVFDADRRGRLISQNELANYTHSLAVAVTEALHYFIGHNSYAPVGNMRYLAATAAHITHMLRDTIEDAEAGYYNIPREVLETYRITPQDITSDAYRAWVRSRVRLARVYFQAGRNHLAQVENFRCRVAGYAYMARFEWVLDAIERDGYVLRPDYAERKRPAAAMQMAWSALLHAASRRSPGKVNHPLIAG